MPDELRLGGEGRGQVQRAAQPQALRDLLVEILDTRRTDGLEHRRPDPRLRVRDVRVDDGSGPGGFVVAHGSSAGGRAPSRPGVQVVTAVQAGRIQSRLARPPASSPPSIGIAIPVR